MKKRTRKLVLQTETLRHLQEERLEKVHGGDLTYVFSCTCPPAPSYKACSNIACDE